MKIWDANIGAARVLVCQMTDNPDEVLRQMAYPDEWLSGQDKVKSQQRRKEFVFVRYLFFVAFGTHKKIVYSPDGKPVLADGSAHISISHSRNYAAVAISADAEIGLDIEVLADKVLRVRKRFLGSRELASLRRAGAKKHHLYWSAKEAVYKIVGLPAVDFAQAIEVEPFRLAAHGRFGAHLTHDNRRFELEYWTDEAFVLVLATPQEA